MEVVLTGGMNIFGDPVPAATSMLQEHTRHTHTSEGEHACHIEGSVCGVLRDK